MIMIATTTPTTITATAAITAAVERITTYACYAIRYRYVCQAVETTKHRIAYARYSRINYNGFDIVINTKPNNIAKFSGYFSVTRYCKYTPPSNRVYVVFSPQLPEKESTKSVPSGISFLCRTSYVYRHIRTNSLLPPRR